MKKLACIMVVLILLIAAVPTQAQRGHAFRGHAFQGQAFRGHGASYRHYRFWGYPYGFDWGYSGLVYSDLYPYPVQNFYPYPAYDPSSSAPPSPPRRHHQAKFLTPPTPLPKIM